MENKIYKIDGTKLNNIRNRVLIKSFTLLAFVVVLVGGMQYFEWGENDRVPFTLFILAVIPLLLLPAYIGTNRLKKAYSTLQIVLSENGVEAKAEMMPYKNITWENLVIKEKADGTVNLFDKNISAFMRIMYGKGWIIIQPETIDKAGLLNELFKHRQAAV